MACLKADADLGAVVLVHRLFRQDNKSGYVAVIFADVLCQYLQIIKFSRIPACNGCVGSVFFFADLLRRSSGVAHSRLFPASVLLQIFLALCQSLRMRVNAGNIRKLCFRQSKKYMFYLQYLLPNDKQVIFG